MIAMIAQIIFRSLSYILLALALFFSNDVLEKLNMGIVAII